VRRLRGQCSVDVWPHRESQAFQTGAASKEGGDIIDGSILRIDSSLELFERLNPLQVVVMGAILGEIFVMQLAKLHGQMPDASLEEFQAAVGLQQLIPAVRGDRNIFQVDIEG
jgi:hypothetical protein